MDLKDLFITPFYLIILMLFAYLIRPFVTNKQTRVYFIPALMMRFLGAIMLGVIYQFYYSGGDTFNYFTHGSRWIYEAIWENPGAGFQMLFSEGGDKIYDETFNYTSRIWYYRDPKSYTIVRIAALFDLLTFHTYSATSLFFAAFSFSGLWAFYSAVAKKFKQNAKWLAIAIFFIPSVIFWGSGILKDSVTLGALGWLVWALIHIIDLRSSFFHWLVLIGAALLILKIKSYIVLAILPSVFIWLYFKYASLLKGVLQLIVSPLIFIVVGVSGYFVLQGVSRVNSEYTLDNFAERAAVTAYDIRYGWGARTGGDGGYDIGIPDGTVGGMVKLIPAAINVSLFRPYLWEVKNPLMLLSALESIVVFVLTLYFMILKRGFKGVFKDPFLIFCFSFAMLFAFAVGVSTANFGTLMRYKIPLMGFYGILFIVSKDIKRS